MPQLLVRHKVRDYDTWRPVFDEDVPARREAGILDRYVLRNADDPNEVVLLFDAVDQDKARHFLASPELAMTMDKAGVTDRPNFYFLDEV